MSETETIPGKTVVMSEMRPSKCCLKTKTDLKHDNTEYGQVEKSQTSKISGEKENKATVVYKKRSE